MSMRVHLKSILPCSAEVTWDTVCRSELLRVVARPMVTFAAVGEQCLPRIWKECTNVRIKSHLFGLIPLGTRSLYFERVDGNRREIQTRECDALIHRWDHLISVREDDEGRTLYTDDVEIDAGWVTPIVWLFAHCFYRHRQRRWRRVARRLAAS
jgi:hypothetical protein